MRTMCSMELIDRIEKSENARYYCKKCKEVARKEKHLCSPKKIKDTDK